MDDQARAFLIYSALLLGVGGGGGFAGGRMTAPATPFEVRFVHIPVPAISLPAESALVEPEDPVPQAPPLASIPIEPEPVVIAPPAQLEEKPQLPQPRPKLEAKPKPKPQPKPEPARKPRKALPSCAVVEREYQRMTLAERWARYGKATPEEIAHGKRCLGF